MSDDEMFSMDSCGMPLEKPDKQPSLAGDDLVPGVTGRVVDPSRTARSTTAPPHTATTTAAANGGGYDRIKARYFGALHIGTPGDERRRRMAEQALASSKSPPLNNRHDPTSPTYAKMSKSMPAKSFMAMSQDALVFDLELEDEDGERTPTADLRGIGTGTFDDWLGARTDQRLRKASLVDGSSQYEAKREEEEHHSNPSSRRSTNSSMTEPSPPMTRTRRSQTTVDSSYRMRNSGDAPTSSNERRVQFDSDTKVERVEMSNDWRASRGGGVRRSGRGGRRHDSEGDSHKSANDEERDSNDASESTKNDHVLEDFTASHSGPGRSTAMPIATSSTPSKPIRAARSVGSSRPKVNQPRIKTTGFDVRSDDSSGHHRVSSTATDPGPNPERFGRSRHSATGASAWTRSSRSSGFPTGSRNSAATPDIPEEAYAHFGDGIPRAPPSTEFVPPHLLVAQDEEPFSAQQHAARARRARTLV